MKYHITPIRMAIIKRSINNAVEGVEKREPSYTVGGNISWCSHYGKWCGGVLVIKSCSTLATMGCSQSGSSVHGILQTRMLEWVAMPFPTKQGLMASTSLGREGAQERQRHLKFLTQGLAPRKSSTHSKFTVSNDQEHSRGPAGFPEGKEQDAHVPSLTEGRKILAHRLSLRKMV